MKNEDKKIDVLKKFYKSRPKIFLGVCGRIAEKFKISPWLIRCLFVFSSQISFILYFILYFIMRKKDTIIAIVRKKGIYIEDIPSMEKSLNFTKVSVDRLPEDLVAQGEKIKINQKKHLYCNNIDRIRACFDETKWFQLIGVGIIIILLYVWISSVGPVGKVFWSILFIPIILYVGYTIKTKINDLNDYYALEALNIRSNYQATFNAFVFSEYIQRRLEEEGFRHKEKNGKFYHHDHGFRFEEKLRYKYSNDKTEYIKNFLGFNFDEVTWKSGSFSYSVLNENPKRAKIRFLFHKSLKNKVVISRKNSDFSLKDKELEKFKKYNMDNFNFNEKFDAFAKDSIDLFKVFTPAYIEVILAFTEKFNIECMSIQENYVEILFDQDYPILENKQCNYYLYNVKKTVDYAESVFRYFMYFMENISPLLDFNKF